MSGDGRRCVGPIEVAFPTCECGRGVSPGDPRVPGRWVTCECGIRHDRLEIIKAWAEDGVRLALERGQP